MQEKTGVEALEPDLRADLERVVQRIVAAGHLSARGERELVIRLDAHGRVRWFEPRGIRVPASELERRLHLPGGEPPPEPVIGDV